MLQDVVLKPLGDGKIERAAIILHGLGDNAAGIMGLGEVFRKILPDTLFLAPDAPFACPHVQGGFQWFGSEDWTPKVILEGIENAAPHLNAYIDYVLETYKLAPEKLALIGFSQGTMMSLYVAPRRTPSLAGI
ncbi:MAG TPA: phospholipase, partial [Rhodospirillaceae bacterium]|nr:phospholipase [Rhodospirillaceae bacterium]